MRNATVHRGPLAISILLLLFGYPRPWRPHGVCVSLLPLVSAGPDAAAQSVPPASSPLPTASSLEHTTQSKVPDSTSSPELVFGNAGGSDSQQGEKALEVIPDESAQEAVSLPSLGSAYFLGNHVSESLDGTTAPPENVPVLASPLSIVQLHDGSRNSASSFPPEFARGANPRNGSAQSSSPSHDLPFASFSPQKKPDQLFSTSFRSIVKIFIDTTLPDFISPWQMQAPRRSSGYALRIHRPLCSFSRATPTTCLRRRHSQLLRYPRGDFFGAIHRFLSFSDRPTKSETSLSRIPMCRSLQIRVACRSSCDGFVLNASA